MAGLIADGIMRAGAQPIPDLPDAGAQCDPGSSTICAQKTTTQTRGPRMLRPSICAQMPTTRSCSLSTCPTEATGAQHLCTDTNNTASDTQATDAGTCSHSHRGLVLFTVTKFIISNDTATKLRVLTMSVSVSLLTQIL